MRTPSGIIRSHESPRAAVMTIVRPTGTTGRTVTVRVSASGATPVADDVTVICQRPGGTASVSLNWPLASSVMSRSAGGCVLAEGNGDAPGSRVGVGSAAVGEGVAAGDSPGDAIGAVGVGTDTAPTNVVSMVNRVPFVVPETTTLPSATVSPSLGPVSG